MEKMTGKLIWLSVNTGTDELPVWEKFACSTSDGFSLSVEEISTSTKCDEGFTDSEPTDISWEFTSSAVAVKDADLEAGMANHTTAAELATTRAKKQFKLSNADDSYYRMGRGFITSYDETAESTGFLEFNLTIKGKGSVLLAPEV